MNKPEYDDSLEGERMRAMREDHPAPRPTVVPSKEMTLAEQLARLEALNINLRERSRRSKIELSQQLERREQEIRQEYQTKLYDEITRLEQERDKKLRLLADEYHQKGRDLEHMLTRLDRI